MGRDPAALFIRHRHLFTLSPGSIPRLKAALHQRLGHSVRFTEPPGHYQGRRVGRAALRRRGVGHVVGRRVPAGGEAARWRRRNIGQYRRWDLCSTRGGNQAKDKKQRLVHVRWTSGAFFPLCEQTIVIKLSLLRTGCGTVAVLKKMQAERDGVMGRPIVAGVVISHKR